MTATLPYKYFPLLRKEKYTKFIQSSKEFVKSGFFSGLSDSLKNIFAQIILTNAGLQLSSNNKITYIGKGFSQSRASLKARQDCSDPYSGDFDSSLVIVMPNSPWSICSNL